MPPARGLSNDRAMHANSLLRPRSALNRGFVRVGDLEMYFEQQGVGRPLLLLHAGFATIESSFKKLRAAFIDGHATIAFEQQAHGHTDDLDRPLSYEQMVEDTAFALSKLGLSGADVFGWSDGGIVALGLATRHPRLVRRVAIVGAGYSPDAEGPEFKQRMREISPDNEHLASFREAYRKVAPHPDRWPSLVTKVRDNYCAFRGWSAAELRALAAPLLVMAGDRDIVRLEHAIELFRMVPRGQLAILPGSDHNAPIEKTTWIVSMLQEFFAA
jgi:pimeloyl-ACP methyl ester carboxylesterase